MLEDILKPLMAGLVMVGLFVVVPVIAILTEHQRKMARILHGQADREAREEIRALREELHREMPDRFDSPPPSLPEDDEDDRSGIVIGLRLPGGHRHQRSNN